ncbi:Histone deacetylase complex subunit SAP30 -like protein [Toxocara canis]|uniref:Histone deacetylase complex subunit SAP30-like protein n=1 Tax=Toxocara canis TaxID=6265 RepID=A0A0B2V7W9_TOXCA|nr:Histone deacetylase complex subunit SAP30 -like protein [Toxocara canis]
MQRQGGHLPSSSSVGISTDHRNETTSSAPLINIAEGGSIRFESSFSDLSSSVVYKNAGQCSNPALTGASLPHFTGSESPSERTSQPGDFKGYATMPGTSGIGIVRPQQQIFFAGYGVDPTTVRNNYYDEETTDEGSDEYSTSSASSAECAALESEAFNGQMQCCIAEKVDGGLYECCPRKACGIWLSETLRELSALKRFPFVYNTAKRHYYICLYHRRVIKNEPSLAKGESLKARELSRYEEDAFPNEEERMEIADDPLLSVSYFIYPSSDVLQQYQTSSAECAALESEAFNGQMQCCIAEKVDGGLYECCPRKACGIWLSETLRELSALKRFPFVYNTAKRHYYICLYHRRVIKNEPSLAKGESLKARELSRYEEDAFPNEEERMEIADDPLLSKSSRRRQVTLTLRSGEPSRKRHKRDGKRKESVLSEEGSESDMSEGYTEQRPRRSARHQSNGCATPSTPVPNGKTIPVRKESEKPIKDTDRSVEVDSSIGDDFTDHISTPIEACSISGIVPFNLLSAASLRRYKKYFKLSHRSGASTKQQLLDGVAEHFATLQVPPTETAACLIYTVRMNRNKLDYPNGSTLSETSATSVSGALDS